MKLFFSGFAFTATSLAILSAANEITPMVIVSLVVGCMFGLGVTSAGYRLVLEMVAPMRRCKMLVFVNCGGALGASLATSLFPAIVWIGNNDNVRYILVRNVMRNMIEFGVPL